ncbi:MAG: histidine--tRNA ligase [Anaerolineaceae bacterium]|nr:MAG: histidine--tRNA ligase [Anaerolineaceae bacterium]
MSKVNPRTPKGFRDFLPADMLKREYVMNTVRDVFQTFGFEPLQTPIIELQETLFGKYGEEAENLIYSVSHGRGSKEALSMRYDLTVPLARVVAQYESSLSFPFKRYQMSPVFRGERPQKGRYREFYQCDVDIVGVADTSADAEVIAVVVTALKRLGFPQFTVKINHRQLLTAIGQYSGVPDAQLPDLYRSVDKFDKIGADGVGRELEERGIAPDVVRRMLDLITQQRPGTGNLDFLESALGDLEAARVSIAQLRGLAVDLEDAGVTPDDYAFDLTMVRGLGYYTGPIFETVITEPNIGSISGGGRYDDLIGLFRRESLPTTGVSLGIERIIDLMDVFALYPDDIGGTVVQALVTVFDESTRRDSARLAARLREGGIRTELFMEDKKLGKQFNHADKKGVRLVAVIGPDEAAQGVVKLKRLADGHEQVVALADAVASARQLLDLR